MRYTVKDISALTGLTPYTIRYYCSIGLFDDVERTRGNVRLFSDADVHRFLFIECMKKTGMSLEEIGEYMRLVAQGDATLPQRAALMEKQEESLELQIRRLNTMLDYVRYKRWLFENHSHSLEELPPELQKDYDPEKIRRLKEQVNALCRDLVKDADGLMPIDSL